MSTEIEYEQFEAQQPDGGGGSGDVDLRRISEVPMELSVEIGRTQMTVGETLQMRAGTVVTLDRLAGDPVDLLVNGTPIARGEVVVVDDKFGLRIKEIVEAPETAHDPDSRAQPEHGEDAAAADGQPASLEG